MDEKVNKPEPKYTLREARQLINEEYCRYNEHDLIQNHVLTDDGSKIYLIICQRCGIRFLPEKKETDGYQD